MMTFRNSFDFLSNFYEAKVVVNVICYQSAEAAFQTQKCVDVADKAVLHILTAVKYKHRGQQVKLRPDWDDVHVGNMEIV